MHRVSRPGTTCACGWPGDACPPASARRRTNEQDEGPAQEPVVREGARAPPGDRRGARGSREGARGEPRALRGGRGPLALLPLAHRRDPEARRGRPEGDARGPRDRPAGRGARGRPGRRRRGRRAMTGVRAARALPAALDSRRRAIEAALAGVLPREGSAPRDLAAAMRYSVLGGGKRFRPLLFFAGAEAGPERLPEDAVDAAAALELLHTY